MCERYINRLPFAHAPQLGTQPATQACTLTGNQIGNPLVCRLTLNLLSHTSQSLEFLKFIGVCVHTRTRERERERERERPTCSTCGCTHWLTLVCALTGDLTLSPGAWRQCSNQLSYQARTIFKN